MVRHPFIYEINTWAWLSELGERTGTPVDLASVPSVDWDAIAEAGFDAVWLMGVWRRSPASASVALANTDLVAQFDVALPGWAPQDVVGSAYSIRDYVVDDRLGGRGGLAAARAALRQRGIALILDFVPNHVALDHWWTSTNPDFFVRGTADDLTARPDGFVEIDGVVLANGKDPYFPAWSDTLQLNAFDAGLRAAAVTTLRGIADQCDGVRCDMAMLVMNEVFAGTWGDRVGDPPADDYWPRLIDAVRQAHPGFVFVAEAYWGTEAALQQQGFDFCYDKTLYDRLVTDGSDVREHLAADPAFQDRLLRFTENHDEPRAAAILEPGRLEAVAVATLTQAGARLVYHGQLAGRRVRLPVFLTRSPHENLDEDISRFYRTLLEILRDSTFRTGSWAKCEASGSLLAWCWDGDRRWVTVVNLTGESTAGRVRLPWSATNDVSMQLEPWGWRLLRAEVGFDEFVVTADHRR